MLNQLKRYMKINYYRLQPTDLNLWQALIRLYEEVFEMPALNMPPEDYLKQLLLKEHLIFYVALNEDGLVLGGLTAISIPSVYYPAPDVYIYDLAVKTAFQRRGIGRQLLQELKEYCRELGCKEIFVQADLPDQHALDFYEATGGTPEKVVHYTYRLN